MRTMQLRHLSIRCMPLSPRASCGCTIALLALTAHGAEVTAERPQWFAGDGWLFVKTSTRTGHQTDWARQVIGVLPNGLRVADHTGRSWVVDLDFNAFNRQGEDYRHFWWRWPLRIGDEWKYTTKFDVPVGSGETVVKRKVLAFEPITVPAGTFECFRVEGSATEHVWDARWIGRSSNMSKVTYTTEWYCPEIRFIARHEEHQRDGFSNLDDHVSELTSFSLARR